MNDEIMNLLQRVRALYHKYGIRSVTMDDVSRELGISKKTLYQHVRDKDELVRKVIELEIADEHATMEERRDKSINAIEELLEITQCINSMLTNHSQVTDYDLKKYYPDLFVKMRDIRRNHIYKVIVENLKKGKEEGIYRENINIEIVTKLNVSLIESLWENEILTVSEFLDPKFFYEFIIYHIRGISNEKGLKLLEKHMASFNALNQ
jgi:AcrR family transcriptional regulator